MDDFSTKLFNTIRLNTTFFFPYICLSSFSVWERHACCIYIYWEEKEGNKMKRKPRKERGLTDILFVFLLCVGCVLCVCMCVCVCVLLGLYVGCLCFCLRIFLCETHCRINKKTTERKTSKMYVWRMKEVSYTMSQTHGHTHRHTHTHTQTCKAERLHHGFINDKFYLFVLQTDLSNLKIYQWNHTSNFFTNHMLPHQTIFPTNTTNARPRDITFFKVWLCFVLHTYYKNSPKNAPCFFSHLWQRFSAAQPPKDTKGTHIHTPTHTYTQYKANKFKTHHPPKNVAIYFFKSYNRLTVGY